MQYDINEKLCVEIKLIDSNGEETMKVCHESIDVLRLSNLVQIFSAGRFNTDVRMVVDISYPDRGAYECLKDKDFTE
jgi:hypothetical protein